MKAFKVEGHAAAVWSIFLAEDLCYGAWTYETHSRSRPMLLLCGK